MIQAVVMVASVRVVMAIRVGPFWERARAIWDQVLMGSQWLTMALAKGSILSSISWTFSEVCGKAMRPIFTYSCCEVEFVWNVALSYQYKTTCVWLVFMDWNAKYRPITGGFCRSSTSLRSNCVTSGWRPRL